MLTQSLEILAGKESQMLFVGTFRIDLETLNRNKNQILGTHFEFIQINATTQQPNVVVIVADDMGHHDLSSMGSHIQTPNIDKLSAEGVKKRVIIQTSEYLELNPSKLVVSVGTTAR